MLFVPMYLYFYIGYARLCTHREENWYWAVIHARPCFFKPRVDPRISEPFQTVCRLDLRLIGKGLPRTACGRVFVRHRVTREQELRKQLLDPNCRVRTVNISHISNVNQLNYFYILGVFLSVSSSVGTNQL